MKLLREKTLNAQVALEKMEVRGDPNEGPSIRYFTENHHPMIML